MDSNKLLYFVKDRGYSINSFAEALGVKYHWLYPRLKGKIDFSITEVKRIETLLQLSPKETYEIFLSRE